MNKQLEKNVDETLDNLCDIFYLKKNDPFYWFRGEAIAYGERLIGGKNLRKENEKEIRGVLASFAKGILPEDYAERGQEEEHFYKSVATHLIKAYCKTVNDEKDSSKKEPEFDSDMAKETYQYILKNCYGWLKPNKIQKYLLRSALVDITRDAFNKGKNK
jgi:hypothetical protein